MRRFISKTIAVATVAGAGLLLVNNAGALTVAEKCQSAIAKNTAKFAQTRLKALQKCEDARLKAGGTGSCPDTKAQTKIDSAALKMEASICKACGGADKACGGAPDVTLSDLKWSVCPGFEGQGAGLVNSVSDVIACENDINTRAVDQLINLLYGITPSTDSTVLKCQRTIGKSVAKFFQTKSKSMQKCWDGRIKGKHSNACPDPGDGKAKPKIDGAKAKSDSSICKACGGPDKACGGTDDISPVDIGITTCPAVTIPNGGTDCGAITISTLQDMVDCLDCVAEYKVDCIDALQVPQFAFYGLECSPPAGSCPNTMEIEVGGGDLDTGFTGIAHDSNVPRKNLVTVSITNCQGTQLPNCGLCDVTGPVPNTRLSNNQRCSTDTSIECTADSDCPPNETCSFFFGMPLPLSAGAVPVCVFNRLTTPITGTINLDTGDSSAAFELDTVVMGGLEINRPCATCEGDITPTDGIRDGTCNGGQRHGLSCDVSGVSPLFGKVSYDCPSLSGAKWGEIAIRMDPLTTGTDTVTITSASPTCSAPGFGSRKCFCDTCSTPQAEWCMSDADCPSGSTCGGKRCLGGPNAGTPCTSSSECPQGGCGVPGEATKPNTCLDNTCTLDPSDTDSVEEGVCNAGPFDGICQTQTFLGCTQDAQCRQGTCSVSGFACAANTDCPPTEVCNIPFPDDVCISKKRECYIDNGMVGNSVTVAGQAGPPLWSGAFSFPTLGALFCIAPVANSSVNTTSGLPGLGRLTVPATVVLSTTGP